MIRFRSALILLGISLGILGSTGIITFWYADGLSYFSKDPQACANCHIMQNQYNSWQMASHHTVATCVDCHLPHDFVRKYIAKAKNGYYHSKGFTLQDFPEPIGITTINRKILQENCFVCHEGLVGDLVHTSNDGRNDISCVHCHHSVGHGEAVGLGGPLKEFENERIKK